MTPTLDLFTPIIAPDRQHPVFQMLLQPEYGPERDVLNAWADGMLDRDGKFVQEFQSTFESGLWELYLHAATKVWGLRLNQTVASPDFVVSSPLPLGIEATIAGPALGGKPAYGYDKDDIPEDFGRFNTEAAIRICNSFTSKVRRYREYYETLPHMRDAPFVIAIASFDRPLAHLAAARPIIAAMYGLYHDEALTPPDADKVVSYNVTTAQKSTGVDVPVGMFCEPTYPDVSAVIFSSVATWGKIRALADNPTARTLYRTFHPKLGQLMPEIRQAQKSDYHEDLLDGLMILHNPFARRPIPKGVFSHPRVCEIRVAEDGELLMDAPDDFLLIRTLITTKESSKTSAT